MCATPVSPTASTFSTSAFTRSIGSSAPRLPFDVAYSNFGPLNCVVDLHAAARADRRSPEAGRRARRIRDRPRLSMGACPLRRTRRRVACGDTVPARCGPGTARGAHGVDALFQPARVRAGLCHRRADAGVAPRARALRAAALPPGVCRSPSAPDRGVAACRGSLRRMAAAPVVRRSLSRRAAEGLSRDDCPLQPHLDVAGEAAAAALAHVARRGPGARVGLRSRRDDADTVDARGWQCRGRPGRRNHRAPVGRAALGGLASRRHRDARPPADAGGCGLCPRESGVGARADRLGRLLSDTARADGAARAVRRLRDSLAGRALAPAADWRAEDRRSAQQRRRPVVESSEREDVSRAGESLRRGRKCRSSTTRFSH